MKGLYFLSLPPHQILLIFPILDCCNAIYNLGRKKCSITITFSPLCFQPPDIRQGHMTSCSHWIVVKIKSVTCGFFTVKRPINNSSFSFYGIAFAKAPCSWGCITKMGTYCQHGSLSDFVDRDILSCKGFTEKVRSDVLCC